ncbi:hypothetical protein LCGC14_1232700 [marine sediment metagenome]|uniref:Disease resistance R13L4/SHOC-2-like LRR domain-containing protein n=1 Tax=marine sediment metagenome TaxID=412755 RepID=A0A0F9LC40_9ZZZZ
MTIINYNRDGRNNRDGSTYLSPMEFTKYVNPIEIEELFFTIYKEFFPNEVAYVNSEKELEGGYQNIFYYERERHYFATWDNIAYDIKKIFRNYNELRRSEPKAQNISPISKMTDIEVKAMQDIEILTGGKFTVVDHFKRSYGPPMSYSLKNNRVNGIGLHKCGLFEIPESIKDFKFLQYLDLAKNELSNLPNSICELNNLEQLSVSYNKLISLPKSIGRLKSLNHLNLIHNKLKEIPESIGGLTNLKYLLLHHNNIQYLPNSIGELKNIVTLNFSNNLLSNLPKSLIDLNNLWEISLRDNKFKKYPKILRDLKDKNKELHIYFD